MQRARILLAASLAVLSALSPRLRAEEPPLDPFTRTGTFKVLVEDDFAAPRSRLLYELETDEGDVLRLRFAEPRTSPSSPFLSAPSPPAVSTPSSPSSTSASSGSGSPSREPGEGPCRSPASSWFSWLPSGPMEPTWLPGERRSERSTHGSSSPEGPRPW